MLLLYLHTTFPPCHQLTAVTDFAEQRGHDYSNACLSQMQQQQQQQQLVAHETKTVCPAEAHGDMLGQQAHAIARDTSPHVWSEQWGEKGQDYTFLCPFNEKLSITLDCPCLNGDVDHGRQGSMH